MVCRKILIQSISIHIENNPYPHPPYDVVILDRGRGKGENDMAIFSKDMGNVLMLNSFGISQGLML